MKKAAALLCLIAPLTFAATAMAADYKVVSERTVKGFAFPESVGCDPNGKTLYVSEFGSALKPREKDGKGYISKLSLDGKVIDKAFLPTGGQTLNKPKGNWIKGDRLWVADIDSVWVFDLKTRKGKKLELPGAKFANDVTLLGDAVYVSDTYGDQLYRVEPADFLDKEPKITKLFSEKSVNPNGLYPAKDGSLLMAGFLAKDKPRGLFSIAPGGEPKAVSPPIGMLDGLYQDKDGTIIATDWVTGSLFVWNDKTGMQKLATGFKGPADLCVLENDTGLMVIVPDLVASELRFVQLGK